MFYRESPFVPMKLSLDERERLDASGHFARRQNELTVARGRET